MEKTENLIRASIKQKNIYEEDVRDKLLNIIKENKENPGNLPDRFFLIHIWLNKNDLEDYISRIGIKATVTQYNYSYSKGHYYVLELIK